MVSLPSTERLVHVRAAVMEQAARSPTATAKA